MPGPTLSTADVERLFQAFAGTLGSSQSLRVVLILLWVHEQGLEGGVQRDLQRYLDIHQNHLSMQIGRLKRDRLVTASVNPTDRSSRVLHLTAAGRGKLVQALAAAGVVLKTKK